MHKISNFTGQARHGWERMTPSMGFGRPNQQQSQPQNDMNGSAPRKGSLNSTNALPSSSILPGQQINTSFNVPFASSLSGLDPEEIIWASAGAFSRWTFPPDTAEGTPIHELPVHRNNVENLRMLCKSISESSGGELQAAVTLAKSKPVPGMQRGPLTALVTNVCISGEMEKVYKIRARILNEIPITLVNRPARVFIGSHD